MARKTRKPEYSRQLRELKLLGRTPCVYALTDLAGRIFYIGQSIHVARRFMQHHWAQTKTINPALAAKMAELGDDVRIVILEKNPANLMLAEMEHIVRNPQAVNATGPDSWSWKLREDKPWLVGVGVCSPSTLALRRCRHKSIANQIRAMMRRMPLLNRCAFELETMADLPYSDQRRLVRWLDLATPKLRSAFGLDATIFEPEQSVAQ